MEKKVSFARLLLTRLLYSSGFARAGSCCARYFADTFTPEFISMVLSTHVTHMLHMLHTCYTVLVKLRSTPQICWKFLTLTALGLVILFLIVNYVPPKCDSYVYPDWAISMGWCISLSSLIWLPLMAMKVCAFVWVCTYVVCAFHCPHSFGPLSCL